MKHSYFDIKNFKGINHVRLEFSSQPKSNIYALVGLNESGKTTILAAINSLTHTTESLGPLELPEYSLKNTHEFIPIRNRHNFNDSITIQAGYVLDSNDNMNIRNFLRENFAFELMKDIETFSIKQSYPFHNSKFEPKKRKSLWDIAFRGKKKGELRLTILKDEEWQKAVEYVKGILPRVIYFPNFLFDFPDRIYLEDFPPEEETDHNNQKFAFYRKILQDVLDFSGEKMDLTEHILNRAKDGSEYNKRALESVLLKMGSSISSVVFKNWNRIFNKSFDRKEVVLDCEKSGNDLWYLRIRIKDRDELYEISERSLGFISERSLGFRWFFSFLFLTQYRGFREDSKNHILFLFDEPASNLHSSAQSQLLLSFNKFPENCSVIYTTHSHYMINPEWLETTYVVKNEGLDYGLDDDEYHYTAKKTVITLTKYREFAREHSVILTVHR